ncbi:MAG: hypothetical protein ACRD9R_04515, partial [Pyrinomonadaceae bacterium]
LAAAGVCAAQETVVVLGGPQLARVVPPGFYFEGQSAPTQARNSAAARLGEKRHVIAGLVDTSGYSADVRAKDERFFITDSPINVGDAQLGVGAYGFGVTDEGKFNVFDVGGREVLSVWATADRGLRRPRPLMLSHTRGELRLYSGRSYVVLAAR